MDDQTATTEPAAPPKRKRKTAPDPATLVASKADPLDAFVAAATQSPLQAIAAMFWHHRFNDPEFTVTVTEADLKAFKDCISYLKVNPRIHVLRPQGLPAQDPIPASGTRRAVPGRAAQPPRPYALIQMTDEDGNTFRAIENNEEDLAHQQQTATLKRTKERATVIAGNLQSDLQAGNYSNATIMEAVDALKILASA